MFCGEGDSKGSKNQSGTVTQARSASCQAPKSGRSSHPCMLQGGIKLEFASAHTYKNAHETLTPQSAMDPRPS